MVQHSPIINLMLSVRAIAIPSTDSAISMRCVAFMVLPCSAFS
jgi:hypothetical protein